MIKHKLHFHFYSRIFIALAIFALGIFFLQKRVDTQAYTINDIPLTGWAWSEYTGWLSLNCNNDLDGDGVPEDNCSIPGFSNWGLRVENGSVQGCAWSGNYNNSTNNLLGWVCFSDEDGSTNAPASGVHIISDQQRLCYPGASGECDASNSYASIVEFEDSAKYDDTEAWQLRSIIGTDTVTPSPIYGCFNCHETEVKRCSGNGADCSVSACPVGESCNVVAVTKNCGNCLQYNYYDTAHCQLEGTTCNTDADCNAIPGDSCQEGLLQSVYGGYDCSSCNILDLTATCDDNASENNLNSCNSCASIVATPGVMIDNQYGVASQGLMCGWAWNAWGSAYPNSYGIGWLQFSPRITTSTNPYFSVESGDIYSGGNIYGRYLPPVRRYNATYLIEAGGTITNFISSSTLSGLFQGNIENQQLYQYFTNIYSAESAKYKHALGALDYAGLVTPISGSVNKYDSTIITTDQSNFASYFSAPLNGKVIKVEGDLHVSNLTIEKGSSNLLGSGVVVVEDGDLYFDGDVTYQSGPYAKLRDIPSIVWIVANTDGGSHGDVRIAGGVSAIAGTIIVLGDQTGSKSCSPGVPGALVSPDAGCGQFISCDSGACGNQLIVNGSVMAKVFVLGRSFHNSAGDPAEWIVNDGHLQANPPRGLTDFSKAVPRFSDIAK